MKNRLFVLMAALLGGVTAPANGATVFVEGFLEGDVLPGPELGDTMDYYKFEVLTSGTVKIEATQIAVYLLAEYIGVNDEFGFIGNPYRIDTWPPCGLGPCPPQVLERFLPAGQYVIAATAGGRTSYDVFDGYVAVNREGGGFQQAPYAYNITGDVRGLEYWDGHLDGTFTVTQIPEPGTAILLGGNAILLCRRSRPGRRAARLSGH